jgi:cytochrome P450
VTSPSPFLNQDIPNDTILGQFFKSNSNASFGDILSTVLDLMLAGIDTTAFSAGFIVYYLAKNPDKQEKLRKEIREFLPDSSTPITPEILARMPFMRACVKEGMRLTPLSVGIGRVTTQEETIIRNYSIPKGTMVITHNQVACRFPENFDRPNDFVPERWIFDRKNDVKMSPSNDISFKRKKPHPFLSLPFGFGPRSCPGRRISDMNTYVLLIQLLRNFQIEYHYEDIGVVTRLINIPDKPMQFRFNDINY